MSDGAFLLAMVHALPDAVVGVDAAGRVRAWNAAAAALFGKSEEDAYGADAAEATGVSVAVASNKQVTASPQSFSGTVEVIPLTLAPGEPVAAAAASSVIALMVLRPKSESDDAHKIEEELPPRLRETLTGLCEGLAEKEIAAKLGLSQHTVHDYVKAIYRRFRVQSRAALVARVVVQRGKV